MIFHCDLCGIFCALLTYMAMSSFGFLWGVLHAVTFNTLLVFAFAAHFRAMVTDPGIVPINGREFVKKLFHGGKNRFARLLSDTESNSTDTDGELIEENKFVAKFKGKGWTLCTRCESYRPPRAHHCRICRRPWVNNCVGEYNQKYFLQFLFYVGLSSLYALSLILIAWVYHDEYGITGWKGPYGQSVHHAKILHTIFLSIESALFGLFVLAVSCDQVQAVLNDETAVEAVQCRGFRNRMDLSRSKMDLIREVCGNGPMILWLLPCSTLPSRIDMTEFSEQWLV
ncbi:unnamed protein product [Thelazia callipaeda]|uniref:Palmitoyltransferase n=1 Tax=Thelazia callipaeda TaxID=103827 RepID=A0A0N5D9M3_THECL|nr:unnamed protein product [Thelazia callipaeda]